jgi:hypothetical protein
MARTTALLLVLALFLVPLAPRIADVHKKIESLAGGKVAP